MYPQLVTSVASAFRRKVWFHDHARLNDPVGYPITQRLLDQGHAHLVLRGPLPLPFPVRLLHGSADTDVPTSVGLRILDQASSPDLRLTMVKGEDHRFSSPAALQLIVQTIEAL